MKAGERLALAGDHRPRWRRSLRRLLRLALTVIIVWGIGAVILSVVIVAYGETDRAERADVIIVLGAGIRMDGRPGPGLLRRATHAAILYEQGYADNVICAGGFPTRGVQRSEADACREVLEARGVPRAAIYLEESSRSTEENAVYSKIIMEENGWQRALVVSDPYHLLRANVIFNQAGVTHTSSPAVSPSLGQYAPSVIREVVALHWQVFKTVLNLPYSYVPWL